MREIKFRAWSKANERMLFDWCDVIVNALKHPIERIELMQYTGLKDKNGKEIYEGDVLSQKFFDDDEGTIGLVKYKEMHGDFCGGIGFTIVDKNSNPLSLDYSEVIGNIYSNPDLLKEEQC